MIYIALLHYLVGAIWRRSTARLGVASSVEGIPDRFVKVRGKDEGFGLCHGWGMWHVNR